MDTAEDHDGLDGIGERVHVFDGWCFSSMSDIGALESRHVAATL